LKKRILTLGVCLALMAALIIPSTVFADSSDSTTVGGTFASATIEVTAPGAIDFETFVYGVNSGSSDTAGSVTVTANSQNATGWQVTAKDANQSTNTGKMIADTTPLTNVLTICDVLEGTYENASTGITYSDTGLGGGGDELPFFAKQDITGSDSEGTYSITIEFSGSVTVS
jgi:hypothetical protein